MIIQNQIKRTLSTPSSIDYIKQQLEETGNQSRTSFAKQLCKHYGFLDFQGKLQIAGCLKALRSLSASGHIELPEATKKSGTHTPRRLNQTVALPIGVPSDVTAIESLEILLVTSSEHMRIWNELMITEHYLAKAILVGRQLRYLIRSEHGWLGGIGYASAALNLSERDRWVGWTKEQRDQHLHSVVNMSRFLIRPSVNCRNLASKVLSMSIRQTTTGLPLGVLKSQAIAPAFKSGDDRRKPSKIPIEEKKTFVWIQHYRDLIELSVRIPHTKLVDVCDREAEFFELFDEHRPPPR